MADSRATTPDSNIIIYNNYYIIYNLYIILYIYICIQTAIYCMYVCVYCMGRAQIASHDVQESPPPVRYYSRKATIKVARAQCILTDYICCMPRVDGILRM